VGNAHDLLHDLLHDLFSLEKKLSTVARGVRVWHKVLCYNMVARKRKDEVRLHELTKTDDIGACR